MDLDKGTSLERHLQGYIGLSSVDHDKDIVDDYLDTVEARELFFRSVSKTKMTVEQVIASVYGHL